MDYISVTTIAVFWVAFLLWTFKDGKIVAFGGLTDRRFHPKRFWIMFGGVLFMSILILIAAVEPYGR